MVQTGFKKCEVGSRNHLVTLIHQSSRRTGTYIESVICHLEVQDKWYYFSFCENFFEFLFPSKSSSNFSLLAAMMPLALGCRDVIHLDSGDFLGIPGLQDRSFISCSIRCRFRRRRPADSTCNKKKQS